MWVSRSDPDSDCSFFVFALDINSSRVAGADSNTAGKH